MVIPASPQPMFFVPQYSPGPPSMWIEFFGFDQNSPYLHVRTFPTEVATFEFLRDPSIWRIGSHPGYEVREATHEPLKP